MAMNALKAANEGRVRNTPGKGGSDNVKSGDTAKLHQEDIL